MRKNSYVLVGEIRLGGMHAHLLLAIASWLLFRMLISLLPLSLGLQFSLRILVVLRRVHTVLELVSALFSRGMSVRLTYGWLTKLNHGRMCKLTPVYLVCLDATPCMYSDKCDLPYNGSPFLTLSVISRMSFSTSRRFSVKP